MMLWTTDAQLPLVWLLRLVLVLGLLGGAFTQSLEFGSCPTYQTLNGFSEPHIRQVSSEAAGYSVLLSTSSNANCQKLTLNRNGTYSYSYADGRRSVRRYWGSYSAEEETFTSPGKVTIEDLPMGVFGTNLRGQLQLSVLMANDHFMVVVSCNEFGLLRQERVSVLVPTRDLSLRSGNQLKRALQQIAAPRADELRQLEQECRVSTRTNLKFLEFLTTLGIIKAELNPWKEEEILSNLPIRSRQSASVTDILSTDYANINEQFDQFDVAAILSGEAEKYPHRVRTRFAAEGTLSDVENDRIEDLTKALLSSQLEKFPPSDGTAATLAISEDVGSEVKGLGGSVTQDHPVLPYSSYQLPSKIEHRSAEPVVNENPSGEPLAYPVPIAGVGPFPGLIYQQPLAHGTNKLPHTIGINTKIPHGGLVQITAPHSTK